VGRVIAVKSSAVVNVSSNNISAAEISRRNNKFSPEQVESIFRYGAIIGSVVYHHERLDRGMDEARALISAHEQSGNSFPSGLVIFADELTAGKGRFQRIWHAPVGGIWMTVVLVNTFLPQVGRLLPLAAGVAVCETVQQVGLSAKLKWVNDVLVNSKKVAGILVESLVGHKSGEEYILIGVGLNVNNCKFPVELRHLACSMRESSHGIKYELQQLKTDLMVKLSWNIGLLYYQEQQQLAGFADCCALMQEQWRKLSGCIGRRVVYGHDVQNGYQYEATVVDLDEDGGLQMKLAEDGTIVTEYGGEIMYL
jgi:BirA family transcriptional regulator, biotin operon repressor / biotin---[acetyl-CoA-carboxylase] ligase